MVESAACGPEPLVCRGGVASCYNHVFMVESILALLGALGQQVAVLKLERPMLGSSDRLFWRPLVLLDRRARRREARGLIGTSSIGFLAQEETRDLLIALVARLPSMRQDHCCFPVVLPRRGNQAHPFRKTPGPKL